MPKIKPTWFDNLIGYFSPQSKLRRIQARVAQNILTRRYEGASVGRRTKNWNASSTSANTEVTLGLLKLRDRSRDLVRNNPYAARGIEVVQNNVVGGKGIRSEIKVNRPQRGRPRRGADPTQLRLNEVWRAWSETTACDFEGNLTLTEMQRIIMRATVESGEVLVRLRRTGRREVTGPDGNLVEVPPVQLQILESDHLDQNKNFENSDNRNRIIQGIEFDDRGRREAYHLFVDHPGDRINLALRSRFQTVRVPASQVLHVYRMDRPGQVRGVPWLSPVIIRLKDLDCYEQFQLVRQQVAACYSAFVSDTQGLPDDLTDQEKQDLAHIEPGMVEYLPPGKSISFANPPPVENYKEYVTTLLHAIASGLGVTYETLTGDLSEVNFSSARMGHLEFQRNIDTWRWQLLVKQFLDPSFQWFLNGVDLLGINTENADITWSAPRREMIDPAKEVGAIKDAIRSGIMTQSEAIRQGGMDPEKFFAEYKADNDRQDRLELIIDSDPRRDANRQPQADDSNQISGDDE